MVLGIAAAVLLVVGGGAVAAMKFFGGDDTTTVTSNPMPTPVASNNADQSGAGQTSMSPDVTGNGATENTDSAPPPTPAGGGNVDQLLAQMEQPAATGGGADENAIAQLEEQIRTNPEITEVQLQKAKAWADSVRSSATDPKTVELIFLIDLLTEDTSLDSSSRSGPAATNGASAESAPAAVELSHWPAIVRSPGLLLMGWLQAGDASEQTLLRLLDDGNATTLVRARAALRLAVLYRESNPRAALGNCMRGLQLIEERLRAESIAAAEQGLLRRQDLQLRQVWSDLNATIAANIAAAEQRISAAAEAANTAAQQAGQASTAADQTAAAARNAALMAVTSYVEQCRQRLEQIKGSASDPSVTDSVAQGEQIANKLLEDLKAATDVIALAPDLQRLSQGVLALESRAASSQAAPVVTTKAELEQFAAAVDLPDLAELIGPGESQESLNPRYTQALDKAMQDLEWINQQLAAIGPDGTLSAEQAQAAQIRIREVLYNALLLEARRQVAQIASSSGGASGPLPAWLVSEQEMTAALGRLRTEFASLRGAAQSVSQLSASVARATADGAELSRRVDQMQAEVRQHGQEISAIANAPPRLSPDQMQSVVEQVLDELVVNQPPAPDVADSPEVNTALATGYYLSGLEAYQGASQQEALRQFTRAVYHDPQNPIYRYYLSLALRRSGRYPEAVAQAQAARKLQITHRRYNVNNALARVQGEERLWLERL
jgi:hypothetical protein